jgi:hypothetical protein
LISKNVLALIDLHLSVDCFNLIQQSMLLLMKLLDLKDEIELSLIGGDLMISIFKKLVVHARSSSLSSTILSLPERLELQIAAFSAVGALAPMLTAHGHDVNPELIAVIKSGLTSSSTLQESVPNDRMLLQLKCRQYKFKISGGISLVSGIAEAASLCLVAVASATSVNEAPRFVSTLKLLDEERELIQEMMVKAIIDQKVPAQQVRTHEL